VYGVASCSLNALSGTTGTSLVVNVTDPLESWSTSATGYDLTIEGERVRVTTAFSAPAGGTQTATVTRSMNGVVRTHTAGAAVLVSDQVRYAY
jgi:transcription initiation factor TFIID subunit TAF12